MADLGDLDRSVILTVAAFTAVVLTTTELTDNDLFAAVGLKNLTHHRSAADERRTDGRGDPLTRNQQDPIEHKFGTRVSNLAIDFDPIAFFDAELMASALDNGVHDISPVAAIGQDGLHTKR